MASNGSNNKQQQGLSGHRPPFFDGDHYYRWKKLMRLHLESLDMDLWYVIEDGPYVPMKTKIIDGVEQRVEACRHELTDVDKRKLSLNSKAMLILFNGLNRNEATFVFMCNSAKEMWQKLEMRHEGTNRVKDSKIYMLRHSYELFEMSPNESICDMDCRLTEIINSLESLGESITNEDIVLKILRILPSEWDHKVTAMQTARDLTVLKKEELIGSLLVHEAKINARKVEKNDSETSSSDDDLDEDDLYEELIKNIRKIVKRAQSKRRSNRVAQQMPKCESDPKCYQCGNSGHISYDCPNKKQTNKGKRRV